MHKTRSFPVIAAMFLSSFVAALQAQPVRSLLPDTINTAESASGQSIDSSTVKVDNGAQSADTVPLLMITPPTKQVVTSEGKKTFDFKQIYKQTFPLTYNGTSIYDIDHDGFNEILLLTQNKLFVHRYKNKTFPKIYEFKAPTGVLFVSIDVADVDNDSAPELYISATNNGTDAYRSMVLEFTKNTFAVLEKKIPYLMRITVLADNKKMLIGQKYSDAGTDKGELFHLELTNNKVKIKEKIQIKNKPIHSFCVLKNKQNNTQAFATLASSGHIELIDMQSTSVLTASEEKYGGNPFTIRLPSTDASAYPVSMLPIRIITADFNNDGIDKIVCVKNNDAFNDMLETTRIFNHTHFEILSFEGTSILKQQWKSGSFSGFISDLAYGDFDNNGTPDLLLIKPVRPQKTFFKKAETELIVLVQK